MRNATWVVVPMLAACAGYSPPAANEPQAELIVTSNLDDTPVPTDYTRHENIFYAFGDAGCKQPLGALGKFVGLFASGGQDSHRVAAGKRLYIRAASRTVEHSGPQETSRYCYNLVSFVPEAGHVYDIHQEAWRQATSFGMELACRVEMRYRDDVGPVKSFAEHRFEGECARLVGR